MSIRGLFLAAAGALMIASTSAQATTYTFTTADFTLGSNSVLTSQSGVNFNLTAQNGTFSLQTVGGVTGVGVSQGSVPGEIDGNEAIGIAPSTPLYLTSFTIAFLYPNGVYGDVGNESAFIQTSPGNGITLTATGATTATVTSGSVFNLAPGNSGPTGGGEWLVSGLDVLTNGVTFLPGNFGNTSAFGDYSLVSVTFADAVPELSTWAMMILGFVSVGFLAYRRSRKDRSMLAAAA